MTLYRRFTPLVILLVASLTLAACKSEEEQAAEYYNSAMDLLAAGDTERAKVELRNALQIDTFDVESRRAFAQIMMKENSPDVAYRNYLYIVEKNPDTPDVRLILAELAIEFGELAEARRHGEAAIALVPDDPRAKILQAVFDYQEAQEAGDIEAAKAAAKTARSLLEQMPDSTVARRIVIDDMLKSGTPADALPEVDAALQLQPDSFLYNSVKLQLLLDNQDIEEVGDQLRHMSQLFPENEDIQSDLIRYYLTLNDLEGAEGYLRELAGDDTDPIENHMIVAQFLEQTAGPAAARAEFDRLAAANSDTANGRFYRAMSAAIQFAEGAEDAAITSLEGITVEMTEASDPMLSSVKVILARLLQQTGNTVGARAQVEEILAADASNVDALKMRATWAIQDDSPDAAITDLRQALNQSPQDADILTLMAEAYLRDGERGLAGERLAQAVEVTNARAPEALRYVQFLKAEGRTAAAVNILADARTADPDNVDVLSTLAKQLLAQGSWVQAQRVADDLEQVGTPASQRAAETIVAAILAGQGRMDESANFLQEQVAKGTGDTRTVLQLVQLKLQQGDIDAARQSLNAALEQSPDDIAYRMMDASLLNVTGDTNAAIDALQAIIADAPQQDAPVRQLYELLQDQGDAAEASTVLQEGIARMPNATTLSWIRAGELEQSGDIEGAIAIFDDLYARDTSNTLIANNLASLISTHRDDPESLEKAATIARRLRDLDVPAFQDTYGWIVYRQGRFEEALASLTAAAEGLPADPLVQFHLGMAQAAAGQNAQARATLTRALEIAGDSPLPQFDEARATLESLPNNDTGAEKTAQETAPIDTE